MPRSGEKVPNRLSATAIAQRSAAQYGHHSAPMYSISGLPPEVSGEPVTGLIAPASAEPAPTLVSVLAGTLRSAWTLAGNGPLVAAACFGLPEHKATVMTATA